MTCSLPPEVTIHSGSSGVLFNTITAKYTQVWRDKLVLHRSHVVLRSQWGGCSSLPPSHTHNSRFQRVFFFFFFKENSFGFCPQPSLVRSSGRYLRVQWGTGSGHPPSSLQDGTGIVETDAPLLWPPDAKNWLIGKDPDAGKLRTEVNRATEDEMAGITDAMDMSLSKLREMGEDRGAWCAAVHGLTKRHAWLSD